MTTVLLVVVVGIALGLRVHDYTMDPAPGANYDGLGWAWQGQSLILQHLPRAWSWQTSYQPTTFVTEPLGIHLPMVSPYFDHPPLFGLLVGGIAVVAGESTPASISEGVIRLVPIALSLLTIVLLYVLVRRVTRTAWIGLLAATAFAVSPAMVLTSRLVESEALLTPLLLAAVILALRVRSGSGRRSMAALVLVCLVAPLVKEPGVIVAVIASAILVTSPRRRLAALPVAGMAAGIGMYLVYAASIDWNLFIATVLAEGKDRRPSVGGFSDYFTSTDAGLGIYVPLTDPVWYVGWVALVLMALWRRAWRPVALAALLYAALIASSASGGWMHWIGWYRIPDEPLVYAAAVAAGCEVVRSGGLRLGSWRVRRRAGGVAPTPVAG
ncbi:MAG TPA: glycosyltransferase family 39 protein [Candidatus Deferrimicrobium sp.]|nr:glycosyltransferase family 39 protein [Candidatus Deferrimicrobium sp.]